MWPNTSMLNPLEENYAPKNRSQSQFRFFWPASSAITKQLYIFVFVLQLNF